MSYYGKYFREFDAALRDAEGGSMGAYECFSRFLLLFSLSLEVANAKLQNRDHGELESQYLSEAKKSRATECYAKAFAVLVGALTASPGDFLGGYVMTLVAWEKTTWDRTSPLIVSPNCFQNWSYPRSRKTVQWSYRSLPAGLVP